MTVLFKNTRISYSSKGSGEALVLLHGFLESSKIWNAFSSEIGNRHIICIDLPGHGNSACLGEIHSMELMAEAVHAVLVEIGVEKADFMGHSMGGYVLLAFLEEYSQIANRVILLNSTSAADSEDKKENREKSISVVQKSKTAYVRMALQNLLAPENSEKFKKEIEVLKSEAAKFPVQGITAALKGMKIRRDRTHLLKEYPREKFFIAGKQDPVLDYNEVKRLSELTNADFIPIPGGHLGPVENQEEIRNYMFHLI